MAAGTQNLIIQLDNARDIERIQRKYGAEILSQIDGPDGQNIFHIQIEEGQTKSGKSAKKSKKGKSGKSTKNLDKLLREIERERGIVSVESNYLLSVDAGSAADSGAGPDLEWSVMSLFWSVMSLFGEKTPTDFYGTEVIEGYANQPALDIIHASEIRSVSTGAGTRVAFIDTGVDPDHPALHPWIHEGVDLLGTGSASELSGLDWSVMSLFSEEVERLNLDWSVMSLFGEDGGTTGGGMPAKFGHGTLVAGLIHAVAPEAELVPIRAFDSYGNSTMFLATAAIYAAVDLDVDVINMSFSIGEDSPAFEEALNYAWSQGVTLVASVGNDGIDAGDIYPAAYPKVIGVAATDMEDHLESFSNFGRTVEVTAPGEIVSTYPGGLYARASGTSFSAPMVSGSIALLASVGKRNTAAARTVVTTSDSIYESNPDFLRNELGQGRINLLNARGVN
jgi:subtilisin family serine protease